jgi:hypothetical protein
MGSSASKFSTGERGDVAGGLLPMEGNRNSKDWGESCLDKLGRFSEGLKEVRLIDLLQKRNWFFSLYFFLFIHQHFSFYINQIFNM